MRTWYSNAEGNPTAVLFYDHVITLGESYHGKICSNDLTQQIR